MARKEHPIEALQLAQRIKTILSDSKAENITILNIAEVSDITDYIVIADATNSTHLRALADEAEVTLKKEGISCVRKSGTFDSHWMILDYSDVVVHVFMPEIREFYSLERLWSDAPVVE
ncbi:MAG: ribosome silencing factor [Spartobacteria bacterium]|nr:ribosome silencing factor [Spartobacteria bacterium]